MPTPLPDLPRLHGDALFTYHVAGTSFHQETLERLIGGRREAPVYFRATAVLSSQPDNPHDSNAIVVKIAGAPVAHIPREDNVRLRKRLNAAGVAGDVQCRAEICADRGWLGVKLDITYPLDVRPAPNAPRPPRPKTMRRSYTKGVFSAMVEAERKRRGD